MTLTHLIERCESGEGADRYLDSAVWYAVIEKPPHISAVDRDMLGRWPSYSSSLDEVVSLIEQKLPGWCPDVGKVPPFALAPDDPEWTGSLMGNEREVTYGHGEPPEMAFDTYNGHASSGARALLAACLRALSALEDSKAGLADANNGDHP